MDTTAEDTASGVRAALAAQKVEVGTLALWLGLSRSSASRKYNGHTPLSIAELRTIGAHLGVDYHTMLPVDVPARYPNGYQQIPA